MYIANNRQSFIHAVLEKFDDEFKFPVNTVYVQDIVKKLGLLCARFLAFIKIGIDKFSIEVAFDPIIGFFFQNELNAINIIEIVEY